MVEVKISSISLTQVGFAILLRSDNDDRVVPIFIGALETDSITSILSNKTPPRPKTHDLLVNILTSLETNIIRVVITELKNNTFYANIHLKTEQGVSLIDARPSDSIALALRAKAPIFIEENVLEEAGIVLSETEEQDAQASNDFQDNDFISEENPLDTLTIPDKSVSDENVSNDVSDEPLFEKDQDQDLDPVQKLRKELNLAVELENYELAARIRDQIKKLTNENN